MLAALRLSRRPVQQLAAASAHLLALPLHSRGDVAAASATPHAAAAAAVATRGCARAFCAGSGPPPPHEAPPKAQQRLLDCALPHVKSLGWTDDALRAGALDAGLSPASVGLLPRGPAQLVEHFCEVCDREFAEALKARSAELAEMRTRPRIAAAVRMRLELVQPHIATWSQALGLQAHPANAAAALRQRAALVDEIWHAAGDTSSDLSWYSKRATLAAAYAATELFMLTDLSPEFEDTWEFLDRRIGDIVEAGKALKELSQAASTVLQGVSSRFGAAAARAGGAGEGPTNRDA